MRRAHSPLSALHERPRGEWLRNGLQNLIRCASWPCWSRC